MPGTGTPFKEVVRRLGLVKTASKGAMKMALHRTVQWVEKTALPRAENRDLDPAMPSLRPSPVPRLSSPWRKTSTVSFP